MIWSVLNKSSTESNCVWTKSCQKGRCNGCSREGSGSQTRDILPCWFSSQNRSIRISWKSYRPKTWALLSLLCINNSWFLSTIGGLCWFIQLWFLRFCWSTAVAVRSACLVIAEPTNGLPHLFPSISWCTNLRLVTSHAQHGHTMKGQCGSNVPNPGVRSKSMYKLKNSTWRVAAVSSGLFLSQHVSLSVYQGVQYLPTNWPQKYLLSTVFQGMPPEEPPTCSDETGGPGDLYSFAADKHRTPWTLSMLPKTNRQPS